MTIMAAQSTLLLRNLGSKGPRITALGLGCMGMSIGYGAAAAEHQAIATLNHAIDIGCNFWDTADMYGNNEELLAKVLKTRRNEVFLASKFGMRFNPEDPPNSKVDGTPEYVKEACDRSLKRLGVKHIDLYYQHRVDPNTPIERTVSAMAELVNEGKVRYLGLSECSAATLRKAYAVHPIAAVQVEYSPWSLDIETNGLLDACKELGVAIVAYSPLGRGFLTGTLKSPEDFGDNDFRKYTPRYQGENFYKNLKIVEKFQEMAKAKGVEPGQLALAWVLKQGEYFFAIPGTTKIENLEKNMAAAGVEVTDEENAAIRALIADIGVAGERLPKAYMERVNL